MRLHHIAALSACSLLAAAASAQFITPNSATATSEFSGSYVIGNTINGSGLPANFTIADAHATYVAGNHWTTQSGHTIGESATFSFSQAQTLGVFHMWNHRSNNIASNGSYEPVLFDLELFSGPGATGSSLLLLTNVVALPNVATGQSFPFNVTADVRSVKFTVRATENNNVSPFTGLAEVRFGPCVEPTITAGGQPVGAAACAGQEASFAVAPSGSGAFTTGWQYQLGGSDEWHQVIEGPNTATAVSFTAVGAASQGVTVYPAGNWPLDTAVRFRAVVNSPCGQVNSAPAQISSTPRTWGSAAVCPAATACTTTTTSSPSSTTSSTPTPKPISGVPAGSSGPMVRTTTTISSRSSTGSLFPAEHEHKQKDASMSGVTRGVWLAAVCGSAVASAQVFQGLGPIAGGTTSQSQCVSADGSVVVGVGAVGALNRPFRWTSATARSISACWRVGASARPRPLKSVMTV
ncbi:MAG: hypothetical protein QM783_02940 [Phycisphaerales bacterium]